MSKNVLILPGDGIGPEIVAEAVKVLNVANEKFNLGLELVDGLVGGSAYDVHGTPLPEETMDNIEAMSEWANKGFGAALRGAAKKEKT